MTIERQLRVGIVGAGGSVLETHAPRLQGIEGVEIVGVCNRTPESGRRAAERMGVARVFETWPDLVRSPDVDAVLIGTWPYLHKPAAVAALEAGKHVLSQSRMAMDAAEARAMLEASLRRPDLVAGLVPTSRLGAGGETIRRLIGEGWIGDLLAVEVCSGGSFIDRDSRFFWRLDREVSGYNAMEIGMIAEALDRIIGPVATVMANSVVNVPMRRGADGALRAVSAPDHVEIIGEMTIGAPYHMRFSQATGMASEGAWFFGSEGTLTTDGYAETLRGARRGDAGFHEIAMPPENRVVEDVAAEFIAAIREGRAMRRVTFAEGVRYMEFTEAVVRSAQSGRKIYLPL